MEFATMVEVNSPINENAPGGSKHQSALGNCTLKGGCNAMQDNSTPNHVPYQSTLAPSEKHLEDWIVANPTAFGNRWTPPAHPERYFLPRRNIIDDDLTVVPFFEKFFARQYQLPNGRADLIMYDHFNINVIELKKSVIDYAVIGQCVRYMFDLQYIYAHIMGGIIHDGNAMKTFHYTKERELYPSAIADDNEIQGMVIGHSFQDKNIPLVAQACGIRVVTYEYNPSKKRYTFREHEHISCDNESYYAYDVHSRGKLAQMMLLVMHNHRQEIDRMGKAQAERLVQE